jgi:hypothetical protein
MAGKRFWFRFASAYRWAALPFGVTPATAWADVEDDRLDVRFGPWRLRTPIANVASVAITGPYAFVKTAGPARLAITDRGLTFATNGETGVLVSFHETVPGLDPLGAIRHPELTLTVADADGFAAALRSAMAAKRA